MIYRPLLNQQIVFTGGVAGFTPMEGFNDLYGSKSRYAGFLGITVKY